MGLEHVHDKDFRPFRRLWLAEGKGAQGIFDNFRSKGYGPEKIRAVKPGTIRMDSRYVLKVRNCEGINRIHALSQFCLLFSCLVSWSPYPDKGFPLSSRVARQLG